MDGSTRRADISAAERKQIAADQYGNGLDPAFEMPDQVFRIADALTLMLGKEPVDRSMAVLVEPLATTSGRQLSSPADWREALDDSRSNCFSEWPLGAVAHLLTAYATYGILFDALDSEEEREQALHQALKQFSDFCACMPVGPECQRLLLLASNRWALDHGQPVDPAAVAYFGGVTEGRIRNMMAGNNRSFHPVGGKIPAHEASAWLNSRDEFWNSIWRDQNDVEVGAGIPLEQAVFVPVARDDSTFHPGLHRGAGYTVGPKGSEEQVAGYGEALAKLQEMPVPYWRRPNESGNWGIVAGIRWERLDRTALDRLATSPDPRIPSLG